ncbi:MAG TPA: ATP-binding protein [Chitinophagales bacterium]|nr:ATP-binding protein [Chitinophagales bacterium]
MEGTRNILLLDSDEQSAGDIQRFLKVSAYAFTLSHASDIQEGLNYVRNRKPDLILLDANMGTQKDFTALKQLTQKNSIPILLLSDSSPAETRRQAEQTGATDYVVKNKINLFHLQKSIANTLKLSETESKLDNKFNQFAAQHETLYQVLNKMNIGVLVLNAQNNIRYANSKAYSILGEESFKNHLADHLRYRVTNDEEQIELRPTRNLAVTIRISNLDWQGERANLFLLERAKLLDEQPDAVLANEIYTALLNSLTENILLLKGNMVVQANRQALLNLKMKPADIKDQPLNSVIETGEIRLNDVSVQSFLAEKRSEGMLKVADGSEQPVRFTIKPLNLGEDFYQLLSFELANNPDTIPGARNDDERFTSEGVLHMASHDLREPVRTILNYVQLISDNLSNGKVEEAKEYAGFAQSAAARMEKLLSDLKVYIALNEHPFQLQKVSMKLVLADVLKQMKPRIDEAQAEVSFTELPDVSADRELVEKLLTQLIDNAIKFRKKDRKPVIDIGFDKFEGNVIFCVRDNGIGISKRYYQKIFELFEKLNRVDEYPGNGLGLAICKKITDLHGGEIWVESLPGSGSNFYFTLKGK